MSEFISSKANAHVKEAFALKGKGGELFLVEGFHLCQMAFEAGCLVEVFALEEPAFKGVKTYKTTKEIIEKLSLSKTPEGIVGVARRKENAMALGNRVLVLDRVQDPGNMGTLVRTALAFGYKTIITTKGTCSPYNPKAIAGSQGSIFKVNFILEQNEDAIVSLLKSNDFELVATGLGESIDSSSFKASKEKVALFLGNEGQGMSKHLLDECDVVLRIDISDIDSLNVGVAGGILMHQLRENI